MPQRITITFTGVAPAPIRERLECLLNPFTPAERHARLLTACEDAARHFGHRVTVNDTATERRITFTRQD